MQSIEGLPSTLTKMAQPRDSTPLQSQDSPSSSISSLDQLPLSPTFSIHRSTRLSSACSSISSSPNIRSSLDGFNKLNPLKEVKEEREKEIADTMFRDQVVSTLIEDITDRHFLHRTTAFPDYDWVDSVPYEANDYDFVVNKRRCADATSTTSLLSSRLTGRFPSIARKFKSIRENRNSTINGNMNDAFTSRSRASSLRSPSIFEKTEFFPVQDPIEQDYESIMNVDEAEEEEEDLVEAEYQPPASRTPLLPPVLALKREIEEPIQSPLQSPSVDATSSLPQSPCAGPNPFSYLPSPPLSSKPSTASFHHRSILPSSEIPIINLADTQDEWSVRLGHANFTITPEPYQLQAPVTLAACQRLKADWELARQNFKLHLIRTGDVYNETSKTYHWTQAKWNEVDNKWKSYHEQALEDVPRISQEALQASFHSSDVQTLATTIQIEIPSSPIVTTSEGKFPTLAAGGIVGPMKQFKPLVPRTSRKRSLWGFLRGVWPSSSPLVAAAA